MLFLMLKIRYILCYQASACLSSDNESVVPILKIKIGNCAGVRIRLHINNVKIVSTLLSDILNPGNFTGK